MPPTVLLVDDQPAVLNILADEFDCSFEVLLATNAEEASFYVRARQDIRAVVVDWKLGSGRDGIELLMEIEEKLPDARRVMVTGFLSETVARDVVCSGIAHACLLKPWSFGAVARKVTDLLAEDARRAKHAFS